MKRVTPNGEVIKQLRERLERLSTQKEMANEIGVSVRMLRKIENENAPIMILTLDRLAKALNAHRNHIVFAMELPKLVDTKTVDPAAELAGFNFDEDKVISRYDYDIAEATSDEGRLYTEATRSHDIACIIETTLTEETGGYAQELFDILGPLTWSKRNILEDIPPSEEIMLRRRIRQLLVLLKGNDVWTYHTSVIRRLPERHTISPEDEPCTHETRFVVALGSPGEYGETTMRVPIDHGQPFILEAWKRFAAKEAPSQC